jgi:putative membrane protein
MKRIGLLPIAFAAMLAVACGGDRARDEEPEAIGTAGEGPDRGDQRWVEEMMAGNMAEVELGKIATDRATNPEVKRFAQMVVRDHTQALDELKKMTARQVQAPAQLPDDHRETVDRFSKLRGAEFDREFMNTMVENHENSIDKLQDRTDSNVATSGQERDRTARPERDNDQLGAKANQWAAKVLPTVRHHLEEAKRIHDTLGRRTTY